MTDQSELVAALQQENASLKSQLADKQRTIAELQQSRALLEALVEHSPSNISAIELDKRLLLVNRASERDAGLSRDQLVGKTQYELYGAETVAEWDISDRQVIEQRQPLSVENVMPLADGDHYFLATKFPLFDAHHNVYAIGT